MDVIDVDRLVSELAGSPEAAPSLAALKELGRERPAEAAAVMERLAGAAADADPERASRWLCEAAALWSGPAESAKRAARALRAAIEIAPADERAVAQLVALYRENEKHAALGRILERRAEALLEVAAGEPVALRRAADAFTFVGDLRREPPIASPAEALAAYARALATGFASPATFRAARAIHLAAGKLPEAVALFALEREPCTDPEQIIALYREEAVMRAAAGDRSGATSALRLARACDPESPGLVEAVATSILSRVEAGEVVPDEEVREAAETFAGIGGSTGRSDPWRAAERCFAVAELWEDACWAAERRGDLPQALAHLERAAATPADRVRVGLHEARLHAALGEPSRASARYAALLSELPAGADVEWLERQARADRGAPGNTGEVAAKLEAAAVAAGDVRALKLAFALAARGIVGVPRAAELVRQAEVLAGLGADRVLAVRHAEAGLEGLGVAEAEPLLGRLSTLLDGDDGVDVYEREVERVPDAERVAAVELAVRAAVVRGSSPRLGRLFEAVLQATTDERALAALENAAAEADRLRGGMAARNLLAAALSRATPEIIDGGRTRSALLRRAARMARRLGEPDQAFEWLGDALFARLEGALEEGLAPVEEHGHELGRVLTAVREVKALLEQGARPEARQRPSSPPPPPSTRPPRPPSGGPQPASDPRAPSRTSVVPEDDAVVWSNPAQAEPRRGHSPSLPPPPPPVPRVRSGMELSDPFPTPAPPPAPLPEAARAPLAASRRRLAGEELIGALFESMHALDFRKDASDAAAFTLTLAMDRLACAVGMVHFFDIDRREFVVVHARGPGSLAVRRFRTSDTDPLAAEALRSQTAVLVRDAVHDVRADGERWKLLGTGGHGIAQIACARLTQAGRYLGMMELAHLSGDTGFADGDDHALTYIANRLTEFVAERGVLLGEDD